MSHPLQSLESNLLAAHLTSAIRHAWFDDIPAGEATADDKLLFGLLRSALTRSPRAGVAEYAQRLAADARPAPDLQGTLT